MAVLIVGGSTVAHAAAPVPAWAAECAARDDDAARLACYDSQNPPRKKAAKAQTQDSAPRATSQASAPNASAAQASPAASAQAPTPRAPVAQASAPQPDMSRASAPGAPAAQAAAPPPATAQVPADFGLSDARKRESAPPKPAEPAELVASVASVSTRLSGELLLKLDNGQSWAQVQRNSAVRIKAGERVSIARGAFGGYLLRSDSGASLRVRRLE